MEEASCIGAFTGEAPSNHPVFQNDLLREDFELKHPKREEPQNRRRRRRYRKHSPVVIKPASSGHGAFAAQSLPKGWIIGEITGEIIDDGEYSSDTCIDLGANSSMEPHEPWKFINHACDPNCEFVYWEDDPVRVWLETLRPIRRGEELTVDYAWPAESAIPCLCGGSKCRGWVVDADELELCGKTNI